MPVDTSIYASLLRPVKSVADYDNEYEAAEQNKLARLLQKQQMGANQMKMDEYTRGVERQNRLQSLMSGIQPGSSLGQRQNALQSGGFWGEADALGASDLAAKKTQSEIDAKKAEADTKNAELIKKGLGYVFNNPTPEAAMQAIAIVEQQTGRDLSLYRQQVQSLQTPEQLKQWAAGHALEVEKQLPKTDITNMGNAQSFGATNPLTGVRTETGSAPIAVSPNTVATNERQAADAAAGRAVQMRGQNMTDARSRDANANAAGPKLKFDSKSGLLIDERTGETRPVIGPDGKPVSEKSAARGRVSGNLEALAGAYEELSGLGAAIDTGKSGTTNIPNRVAASWVGQMVGGAMGTKEQSVRNRINQMRPLLLQEIRQATEMGARGLDSNKELEFYLQAATDPARDIQANIAALDVLDNAYGLGMGSRSSSSARSRLRKEFTGADAGGSGSWVPSTADIDAEIARRKGPK